MPQPRAWCVAILGGLILAGVLETTSVSHPRPVPLPSGSYFDYSELSPEERAARRARRELRRRTREAAAASAAAGTELGTELPPPAGLIADDSEPVGPAVP